MSSKKKLLYIVLILIGLIMTSYLSVQLTLLFISFKDDDTEYKKWGIDIDAYSIEYCTKYDYGWNNKYKVYKIKNNYSDSMNKYQKQLEESEFWTREKYYEYIMVQLYEKQEKQKIDIDRENLYYYHTSPSQEIYAVFDLKNAKLYCFERGTFWGVVEDYSNIFGIKMNNITSREIYNVRGGPQNDGTDYYVYEFTDEKGQEIVETLNNSDIWSKEKLDDNILDAFQYNEEVMNLENGYYHYKKVCRTSDSYKKEHFTEEEATGYEIGVYDPDKNILYYYYRTN